MASLGSFVSVSSYVKDITHFFTTPGKFWRHSEATNMNREVTTKCSRSPFSEWRRGWAGPDRFISGEALCHFVTGSLRLCHHQSVVSSSHKWPFNRLFSTLTPRLLLPHCLSSHCIHVWGYALKCAVLFLSSPTAGITVFTPQQNTFHTRRLTCCFVAMVSP